MTPPPPPPLPPPTFAVTLPTSITFSRSPTANPLHSPFGSELREGKAKEKGPPPPYPSDSLSKEAQDILKISQDLSNFGKAHAQTESERLFSSPSHSHHSIPTSSSSSGASSSEVIDYDSNAFAMLLDEVEKDAMTTLGRMEMDMDNHHHPQHFHHQGEVTTGPSVLENHFQHHPPGGTRDEEMSEDHRPIVKHEELLDELELGTLLPPDLDVSMPMEMDYSDWLDQLLPENQSSRGVDTNTTALLQPPSTTTPTTILGGLPLQNNFLSLNNNFFMDYNDSFGNRDPLLSSSFNIFSGESGNQPENELKPPRAASPSPMTIGDNLLWDLF